MPEKPTELRFRRCVECSTECQTAYEACPSCGASFATPRQHAADVELARALRRARDADAASEAQRARAREAEVQQTRRSLEALQRSEEDEALAKEELLLKTERLLSDALEGKASRHKGREDGWDHELARNEAPLEHRYDEAIHEVEARRRALRPPPPPSGRADDGHATPGTMLALIGGLVLLVALGIVFREVEHGSTGRARVVGLVGLALVAGGVGWNALRRQG